MITICYYVSDYGYGHAARSIAIIRMLVMRERKRLKLIICASRSLGFLRESLKDCGESDIEYHHTASDLGYCLKANSIEPDLELLHSRYGEYIAELPKEAVKEKMFLLQNKADLVISDISPIPLLAANLVNIRSVGVSNFTWFTAYKQMLNERLLAPLYDAYSVMDYFVALPGAGNEPDWGRLGRLRADFFCRKPEEREVSKLRVQLNPDGSRLVVFFALGMSVGVDDLAELPLWDDESCLFIVSGNMKVERANVFRIPGDDTESQNYVAASDIVMTKPGWGTVSEAVKLNKPLILLDRSSFTEDVSTIDALNNRHPYGLMSWEWLKQASRIEPVLASMGLRPGERSDKKFGQDAERDICEFIGQIIR
ncbi:hypothetical protein [Paenibacillus nasutitermitis]|uniref:Glycosyl transferase family 28 C-terminal domain-containing protein n=1 Tax=Paenibacillus nasutitermitis TaxID=1652958 RepID=A0A917DVV7_9BACL|nr:hypothetical protein [Paenibacillus nasutitermitis]GGD76155.1 hypothetical protein GCM10010911_37720 [Paenibacillus nasutitermitis]